MKIEMYLPRFSLSLFDKKRMFTVQFLFSTRGQMVSPCPGGGGTISFYYEPDTCGGIQRTFTDDRHSLQPQIPRRPRYL